MELQIYLIDKEYNLVHDEEIELDGYSIELGPLSFMGLHTYLLQRLLRAHSKSRSMEIWIFCFI